MKVAANGGDEPPEDDSTSKPVDVRCFVNAAEDERVHNAEYRGGLELFDKYNELGGCGKVWHVLVAGNVQRKTGGP